MGKVNRLENKKGVELTLNMIIILIICLTVLIVMIYFFSENFLSGSKDIASISNSTLGKYGMP
jgi:uncharacterized membrane protein